MKNRLGFSIWGTTLFKQAVDEQCPALNHSVDLHLPHIDHCFTVTLFDACFNHSNWMNCP